MKGAAKYGTFNLAADPNGILKKAVAQISDARIDLAPFLLKVRVLQTKARKKRATGQEKTP